MNDLFDEYNHIVCGIDEAGRGPLAGPVVAACVLLDSAHIIPGLDDSKKLSAAKREALFAEIVHRASRVGLGYATHQEIDRTDIRQATLCAMLRAFEHAGIPGAAVIGIDGRDTMPGLLNRQMAIIGGDGKVPAIGAASIVAKVMRDWLMESFDAIYPGYGFSSHKGYGTKAHFEAIRRQGMVTIHRRTFIHL